MENEVPTTVEGKVGLFKKFLSTIVGKIKSAYSTVSGIVSNDKVADGIMRWPRPTAFFLIVSMFIFGWFHPATLLAFAQAIAVLPEHFWDVIFIVLGSVAASKGVNDIAKILAAKK